MSLKEAFIGEYGMGITEQKESGLNVSCKSNKLKLEIEVDIRDIDKEKLLLILGDLSRAIDFKSDPDWGNKVNQLFILADSMRQAVIDPHFEMSVDMMKKYGEEVYKDFVECGAIDESVKIWRPQYRYPTRSEFEEEWGPLCP